MDGLNGDAVRFSVDDASGRSWTLVDLARATMTWHPGGEEERPVAADDVAQLRALAQAVRPEHADAQSTHITYGCQECLEVTLGDQKCVIDIFGGVIDAGPPHAVVKLLLSLRRGFESPTFQRALAKGA